MDAEKAKIMNKPTIKEIAEYMDNQQEAILFYNYYESIEWKVGRNKMKSWKHAASGWLTRNKKREEKSVSKVDKALANKGHRLTDRLWKRFTEIYGHKWTSSYGAEPTQSWINAIESLQPEEIKRGLNQVLKNGDDWPVSLVKFLKLCKSNKSRWPSVIALPWGDVQDLRESTKQTRMDSLAKIRLIL